MKVGDKILCKKDYDVPWISFEKNEYYFIHFIQDENRVVPEVIICTTSAKDPGVCFVLDKKLGDSKDYLWDYFYTEKELRRFKLNKLKC